MLMDPLPPCLSPSSLVLNLSFSPSLSFSPLSPSPTSFFPSSPSSPYPPTYISSCVLLCLPSPLPSLPSLLLSIQMVADTAQLAKIADSSIKKLRQQSRRLSPVRELVCLIRESAL